MGQRVWPLRDHLKASNPHLHVCLCVYGHQCNDATVAIQAKLHGSCVHTTHMGVEGVAPGLCTLPNTNQLCTQ